MTVAERTDTYGIHHWRILWSSYRKLAWVGFEPTTTEFRSDALTDWAIRPWVQLAPMFTIWEFKNLNRAVTLETFSYVVSIYNILFSSFRLIPDQKKVCKLKIF